MDESHRFHFVRSSTLGTLQTALERTLELSSDLLIQGYQVADDSTGAQVEITVRVG